MINENSEIVQKLKERYPALHPLLFQRSCERANSDVELFDILDTVPPLYPILWDESKRRWVHTEDLTQLNKFQLSA